MAGVQKLRHYAYWAMIWGGGLLVFAAVGLFIFGGLLFSAWAPPR